MRTLGLEPKLSFRFKKGPKAQTINAWERTGMGLAGGSWGYLYPAAAKAAHDEAKADLEAKRLEMAGHTNG